MMNICWVVATGYTIDPVIDLEQLKSIGPIWGSWTTWRACATDNVICHDRSKAQELITRQFHERTNLYMHRSYFHGLGRPTGVKLYSGEFESAVDHIEDIVALHLAGQTADLVLMLNFHFGQPVAVEDTFDQHKLVNRHGLVRSVIAQNSNTQWIAVDHMGELSPRYRDLPNLTCDSLSNVLHLLAQ